MAESGKSVKSGVVIRAGIWYTMSSFMTKGISFLSTPVFTRLLSSNDYGEFSNFVAWAGIVVIVATMDMHATVNRARYDYENLDGYLSSVAICGTVVTTILWGIVQLFPAFFTKFFSMEMPYINILFITTMVSPALTLLQAKNRINYRYKTYVALSFGSALLATGVSLILVLLMKNQLAGRIIGHYGTVFLIDLCVYIYILYKGRQVRWDQCRYALLICIPMIPHLLSKYILNQSDRIMIKQFCGASDTAFYSLAYSCAMIPIMLGTATNVAWSPWSSEQIYKSKFETVRKASYYYILGFYLIVLAMFLLGTICQKDSRHGLRHRRGRHDQYSPQLHPHPEVRIYRGSLHHPFRLHVPAHHPLLPRQEDRLCTGLRHQIRFWLRRGPVRHHARRAHDVLPHTPDQVRDRRRPGRRRLHIYLQKS